ncbi:MAG: response regulator transcription factor [Anaerolineales bacterium]|nr:response regulator transcription factor [Anaerolineales bacterium]
MKILIADPHPEVQSALQLILHRIPEVTEVREAGSLVQLLALCAQSCPDLILFDLNLVAPSRSRAQSLADFISVLRRLCPCSQLVGMSSRFETEQEAKIAGANGYISKTAPPDEVLSSIVRFLKQSS